MQVPSSQSETHEVSSDLPPPSAVLPMPDHQAWPIPPTNPQIIIPAIAADGTLYPVEKIEAHVKGLQHLALSIFIFCDGDLLLQRRAKNKYHCGGLWANTCCTHPDYGEDMDAAAQRRLKQELGFQVPLQARRIVNYSADVGNGLRENERVHMFRADVSRNAIHLKPNPEEVCETRWISNQEMRAEISNSPENFTPWMRIYVERFPDLDF